MLTALFGRIVERWGRHLPGTDWGASWLGASAPETSSARDRLEKSVVSLATTSVAATTPVASPRAMPPAPEDVVKCKLDDLSDDQFNLFIAVLGDSNNPQAQALGDRLARGKTPAQRLPHVLHHMHADGTERIYVISRTWAQGSYGKFHHVLELWPEPRHLAAKDFREGSRLVPDIEKMYHRIARANVSDVEVSDLCYGAKAVAELEENGIITPDQAAAIAANPPIVVDLLKEGVLTAEEACNVLLNADAVRKLLNEGVLVPAGKGPLLLTKFVEAPAVRNEYELVARAKSPLQAIDRVAVDGRILMISQVMDGEMHLAMRVNAQHVAPLTRHLLACVGRHMAVAHAMGVAHRDLKPENLLFDIATLDIVPSDFGLGTRLVDGLARGRVGTPGFAAPELLSEGVYTAAADVFSLGMVAAKVSLQKALLPGRGRSLLAAPKDFINVRRRCLKSADGLCDLSTILAGPATTGTVQVSPNEQIIREALHKWYTRDPEMATYVFTHMLAIDPIERHTMAQVAERFAPQPNIVKEALGKFVPRDRIAGDLAIMKAFGAAYMAGLEESDAD